MKVNPWKVNRWNVNCLKSRVMPGLLAVCVLTSMAWGAKKSAKTVMTPDGRPIRKVWIQAYSAAAASAAQAQLTRDTCLAVVPQASEADAVLDLSVALPSADSSTPLPEPNAFARQVEGQTPANKNDGEKKSASFNCTSGKGAENCANSYAVPAGDIADLPASPKAGGSPPGMDVSLLTASTGGAELWEPREHSKQPWTDQLRATVGCPACPGEHFNRRRDKSYRQWIEERCKNVLSGETAQK